MGKIEQSIDVNVPVTTAYNQWTQFEEFPKFMSAVKRVEQLDDETLEWTAEIGGREENWKALIATQEPDKRVAWHSTAGPQNAGAVAFERIDDNRTRVTLQMDWQPQGIAEKAGDALGFDDRQVRGDLERFKKFIEERHTETGAWRGEIKAGERVR
jgi:uncharacterized membrane protein